ncbi:hypothetical protein HAX54_014875 [Datura stramonium]|uniref:Uncharacterized protein n=1 Tax=Datura stramonium TaxID=4076 RepID=A0ABS8TNT1_DATST|nr:hypothetical protein [Datura stramonium]
MAESEGKLQETVKNCKPEAREKELKKLKAAKNAEAIKQVERRPEDFVDPETPLEEKKKLSHEMVKTFNPSVVEKSDLIPCAGVTQFELGGKNLYSCKGCFLAPLFPRSKARIEVIELKFEVAIKKEEVHCNR